MQLIADILASFLRLPLWVQVWVGLILVPVNLLSLQFIGSEGGLMIAGLAIGGIALNLPVMIVQRGFSKLMALPHILCWTPLLVWLIAASVNTGPLLLSEKEQLLLLALIAVNLVSLIFDFRDMQLWLKGERSIA